MAVIVLSITESENQILSGIPEYVEFETNVPATVFYTLDGTDPDTGSDIAVGKVYLPTNVNSLTLRAVAIAGSSSSSILEREYAPDLTNIDRTRNIGEEGIRVLPAGEEPTDHIAYDEEGGEARATVPPLMDLDLKTSKSNRIGEPLDDRSSLYFVNFQHRIASTGTSIENRISSPNDNNVDFDPRAGMIVIDGSTEEKLQEQVVKIINRPHNSMDLTSDFYNEHLPARSLVSANLARVQYNPITGKMVFYYRDSRENRWIKSTQQTDPHRLNLTPTTGTRRSQFVFKWVEDRYLSKIF